ncbi:hypothetical protein KKG05_10120 [bacterium]|nr:hypothetical protein [bacterium]
MKGECASTCQLMFNGYRAMGYNVLGMGRAELALGRDSLEAVLDTIKIPAICANVVDAKTNKRVLEPYYIQKYGNMVIGVMALINDANPRKFQQIDTTFALLPYLDVAKSMVPKLKRKVDAVVLLCDLDLQDIDTLLKVAPQIDIVITRGPLRPRSEVTRFGKTLIVPTGTSGHNGTALTLEFNPSWGDSIGYDFVDTQLTDDYEGENSVSPFLTAYSNKPKRQMNKPKSNTVGKPAEARRITPESREKSLQKSDEGMTKEVNQQKQLKRSDKPGDKK